MSSPLPVGIERIKAEADNLYRHGDLMLKFASENMPYPAYATMAKDWLAVKEGKTKCDLQSEEIKAYINGLEIQIANYVSENALLKAEVERMTALCKQLGKHHSDISCDNIMLRKAGDAMASSIQFNEFMAQDYNGPAIVHQCVQRWNAAKDGQPQ